MFLVDMKLGQSGKVVDILGGHVVLTRLDSLGVRVGQKITKTGSTLMRGPVVIQIGTAKVAIGFGMARKVIVELDE